MFSASGFQVFVLLQAVLQTSLALNVTENDPQYLVFYSIVKYFS